MKKLIALALILVSAFLIVGCTKGPGSLEPEYLSEINVELGEWYVKPVDVYAKAGQITFTIMNNGVKRHEFLISGFNPDQTVRVNAGASATKVVTLEPGEYEIFNPIAGAKEAGMVATLYVA